MAESRSDPPTSQPTVGARDRLDSWKEIAAYLRRNVSTVQRWEKREGLPVHRHLHDKLGSVYALRSELDSWWRNRSSLVEVPHAPVEASPRPGPLGSREQKGLLILAAALCGLVAALWLVRNRSAVSDNPLANARFSRVTDFEGAEHSATISRDGKLIAFLADRDGPTDVWITRVGSGQFQNLTQGRLAELVNPSVRDLGFSPDGTNVLFWLRKGTEIGVWAVPITGGSARPYLEGVAEFDWSKDGRRLVFHTPGAGDPLFVKEGEGSTPRQIFVAASGTHAHFPIWSTDEAFIYFVQGVLPDGLDVWRLRPSGGTPERLTSHNARVSHPIPLDRRRLLYLATDDEGSGPWLHSLDLEQQASRRVVFGVERYTSLAADSTARRVVATVANPTATVWRVPISDRAVDSSAATRITLPTLGGRSPRFAPKQLVYVSSTGGGEGIWKLSEGKGTELWSSPGARVVGGPAIAPDGRRIAFSVEKDRGTRRLYVMNDDGSDLRALTDPMDLRGSPAWSPTGKTVVIASYSDGAPQLFSVPVNGGAVVPLRSGYALDPVWSPDGRMLVYSGPDVGTTFSVSAVTSDGAPASIPKLTLTRGARRLVFVRDGHALVVLRGEIEHKDFWLVDLESGSDRRLTSFTDAVSVHDFDVSPDEREIVFDRVQDHSDVVLIERQGG